MALIDTTVFSKDSTRFSLSDHVHPLTTSCGLQQMLHNCGCRVPLEVAVRMALTWASPDRPMLSLAPVSQCKWRFVGNTAQPACVDDLLNALDGFLRHTRQHHQSVRLPPRHRTRDHRPAPGRGSLRCHARLHAYRTLQQNELASEPCRDAPVEQATTIPAIGAPPIPHLERCDDPYREEYGGNEYGGLPVEVAVFIR